MIMFRKYIGEQKSEFVNFKPYFLIQVSIFPERTFKYIHYKNKFTDIFIFTMIRLFIC
jgi:hypothetical protein